MMVKECQIMPLTKMYPADFTSEEAYELDYAIQMVGWEALKVDPKVWSFCGDAYKDDNSNVVIILEASFRDGEVSTKRLDPQPTVMLACNYVFEHYKELASYSWFETKGRKVIQ